MMSGTTYKQGSIVLVPFPYTDLSSFKQRPVLLIKNEDAYGDFVCLAITSQARVSNALAVEPSDLATGKLNFKSWVRTDKLYYPK